MPPDVFMAEAIADGASFAGHFDREPVIADGMSRSA
jgi:hypothetical protein